MLIRCQSDLHLEFGIFEMPELPNENQQVLVLAGDIGIADKPYTYKYFLEEMSERFRDVIYIMGNHEYYHTSVLRGVDKIKKALSLHADMPNVHVMDNQVLNIDDVSFVCTTLWTNFDNLDALAMYNAGLWMSDYKVIRTGTVEAPYMRKFKPSDAAQLHHAARTFLFDSIKREKAKGRKVVAVTHHAPSRLSISKEYKTGQWAMLNGAYASNLEEDIFESKPDLMIHGHIHSSFDYELVDELAGETTGTRIICNPRGYEGEALNPTFNPNLVVEL